MIAQVLNNYYTTKPFNQEKVMVTVKSIESNSVEETIEMVYDSGYLRHTSNKEPLDTKKFTVVGWSPVDEDNIEIEAPEFEKNNGLVLEENFPNPIFNGKKFPYKTARVSGDDDSFSIVITDVDDNGLSGVCQTIDKSVRYGNQVTTTWDRVITLGSKNVEKTKKVIQALLSTPPPIAITAQTTEIFSTHIVESGTSIIEAPKEIAEPMVPDPDIAIVPIARSIAETWLSILCDCGCCELDHEVWMLEDEIQEEENKLNEKKAKCAKFKKDVQDMRDFDETLRKQFPELDKSIVRYDWDGERKFYEKEKLAAKNIPSS